MGNVYLFFLLLKGNRGSYFMIWKFLAKIYKEIQEPELRVQITIYFMKYQTNKQTNGYFNSELIKTEKNMIALTLVGWFRDTHSSGPGKCQTMYSHPVERNKVR